MIIHPATTRSAVTRRSVVGEELVGDSGGPVLGGDVAGALIAFGSNDVCKGSHFAARLNLAPVQTWALGFLE